jgi:hypothetical protein
VSKILTNEEFISRARNVHGDKYIYDFSEYLGFRIPLKIVCKEHGHYMQRPVKHLSGSGCHKCGRKASDDFNKPDFNNFLERATKRYGDHYEYFSDKYINYNKKTAIKCNKHNYIFSQTPNNHLKGKGGCGRCNKRTLTIEDRIKEYNNIHNFIYDYSEITIEKHKKRSKIFGIICSIHGKFDQLVFVHLQGHGCPSCGMFKSCSISDPEIEWLDSLLIPEKYRQNVLKIGNKIIKVDAYIPETNTIYEYYGHYWHGNSNKFPPQVINKRNNKTFEELYKATIERESLIKSAGYNLVSIWEKDWKNGKK